MSPSAGQRPPTVRASAGDVEVARHAPCAPPISSQRAATMCPSRQPELRPSTGPGEMSPSAPETAIRSPGTNAERVPERAIPLTRGGASDDRVPVAQLRVQIRFSSRPAWGAPPLIGWTITRASEDPSFAGRQYPLDREISFRPKFCAMRWLAHDPGFVSAVERRYLAEAPRRIAAGLTPLEAHRASLSAAIYSADPTNGGLRFRGLDAQIRAELEERLLRFVDRSAFTAEPA